MTCKWSAALSVTLLLSACGDDSPGGNNNQNQSQPVCGNGELETGEQCDDGAQNSDTLPDACRTDCRLAYCGDRILDAGEGCDDGPSNSDFLPGACRSDCQPFGCGDGVADPGETCDDGNATAGDGCSDQCATEDHWQCSGAPSLCTCLDFRRGDGCAQCRVFVSLDATGSEPEGLTWETAFPTVQQGIDAGYDAGPGCEVWVAAGTYRIMQSSIFDTVELRRGVGLYGGFAGGETERSQRDWQANETILDGEHVTEDRAVMHVVTAEETVDATLDGFVVRGGFAQGPHDEDNLGAGMVAFGAVMTIENCRFADNYAIGSGGGLYAYGANLTFRGTSFVNNSTRDDGGGLLLALSTAELSRCEIRDNETVGSNAGAGGGLNIQASEVHAVNSLIAENIAAGQGGGIFTYYSSLSLLHCTVADNVATSGTGHGFHKATVSAVDSIDLTSSILADSFFPTSSPSITASYCVLPGLASVGSGPGNTDQPATFMGVSDYHLTDSSQGIDRADGLAAPATDLEGNARYDNPDQNDIYNCAGQPSCVTYADCGAYEYHVP